MARRGHAAVVANGALFVIGGRSREQVRIDDERLVGGVMESRVTSSRDYLTVREHTVLKNDIWVSRDGLGKKWSLVTIGCRDPQEDILTRTEVWSKESFGTNINAFAGSSSATCTKSADCYGDVICKVVGGSWNKVCVCPMFNVREHHSVSVQYRYFVNEANKTLSETYMYLVGGFTNVRQNFCANRSCGFRGSYRMALDDAWVSTNGVNWIQIRSATSTSNYKARGSHSSILMHANMFQEPEAMDRLWIFGGENVDPNSTSSKYLNDVWTLDLSIEPCCARTNSCDTLVSGYLLQSDIEHCFPTLSDWKRSEVGVPWSGRAGHISIYEPPSSLNAFKDIIYLAGGKNESMVHSDVWCLDVSSSATSAWKLDYSIDPVRSTLLSITDGNHTVSMHPYQFHFDVNSFLSSLVSSHLPVTKHMRDEVFEEPTMHPIFSEDDISYLEGAGLTTLADLHSADQRTILNLRDFVRDICYVKALVNAFEAKCSV